MRSTFMLFATGTLAFAAPATEGDIPNGIGTGVTKAIAPNEPIPMDCITDFPVDFGIAVEMAPIGTPFRGADGVGGVDGEATGGGSGAMLNQNIQAQPKPKSKSGNGSNAAGVGAPKPAGGSPPAPASMDMSGMPGMVMKYVNEGVARAAAAPTAGPVDAANGDTTVTVRSTRYTTKTYTVSKLSGASAATPPAAAAAVGGSSGNVVKAAVIRQIGDGQVQMPHKPTDVTVKPTQTAFAPLSSNAPRISQIGDGQIQGGRISQIPDGQVQAKGPKSARATAAPAGGASAGSAAKGGRAGGSGGSAGAAAGPVGASAANAGQASFGASLSLGNVQSGDMSGMNMKTKRQLREICPKSNTLGMTLKNSILKDKSNRIGYAADNMQFQFDSPPQAGAIYTAGFSVCKFSDQNNESNQVEYLGWGNSTDFYACNSGEFSNLYSPRLANIGPVPGQCYKVKLTVTRFGDECS